MNPRIKHIVEKLELEPHPEGGFFIETYRSQGMISAENLGSEYNGSRNFSTCIYFLLTSDNFSAWHRIKQDEIWHFYDGSPIKLHMINTAGKYSSQLIGRDFRKGELPQFIVPGGCWFATEVAEPDSFSLSGCTVSPGFDFEDFEMLSREKLIELFPDHKNVIVKLTRE
jgi:hypothetical protein